MVATHARVEAQVLAKVPARPLAEELLPAVAVLRHRRVGVALVQAGVGRVGLLVGRTHAGGGGVEEALDVLLLACLQYVRVDQHREHAERLLVLDEAHATDVAREVVDLGATGDGLAAWHDQTQVEHQALGVLVELMPLLDGPDVDRAHALVGAEQVADQMPANGFAASAD